MWTGQLVMWLVASPLVGSVSAALFRKSPDNMVRDAALANATCTALVGTALALAMWPEKPAEGRPMGGVVQWTLWNVPREWTFAVLTGRSSPSKTEAAWLEVGLSFGADGLNAPALLWVPWWAVLALLHVRRAPRVRFGYGLFCLWEACLLGCFAAYDALTFLFCDAAALAVGAVLVAEFGDEQRRLAAGRFWCWQFAGWVCWATGLVALGVVTAWCRFSVLPAVPTISWSWAALMEQLPHMVRTSWGALQYWESASPVLLLLLTFGCLMRSPAVGWHAWWPAAAASAPTGVALLISMAWCPLGVYAWLRFIEPSSPPAALTNVVAFVGAATALGGGLLAWSQTSPRSFAPCVLLHVQGLAWLAASVSTVSANWCALVLSQAAAVSGTAWLSIDVLTRTGRPGRGLPRSSWLVAILALGVLGIPSLARGPVDLLALWSIGEVHPTGMAAAVAGALVLGWRGVSMLRVQAAEHTDPASLAIGPSVSRAPSSAALVAAIALIAWSVWVWCQPISWPLARIPGLPASSSVSAVEPVAP